MKGGQCICVISTFLLSEMMFFYQTISFLRDERHKQAGEVPAERSGVSSTQETQISGKIGKSKSVIRSKKVKVQVYFYF